MLNFFKTPASVHLPPPRINTSLDQSNTKCASPSFAEIYYVKLHKKIAKMIYSLNYRKIKVSGTKKTRGEAAVLAFAAVHILYILVDYVQRSCEGNKRRRLRK